MLKFILCQINKTFIVKQIVYEKQILSGLKIMTKIPNFTSLKYSSILTSLLINLKWQSHFQWQTMLFLKPN